MSDSDLRKVSGSLAGDSLEGKPCQTDTDLRKVSGRKLLPPSSGSQNEQNEALFKQFLVSISWVIEGLLLYTD